MSIFRRGRGGPGRVTVQEAAVRTGHGKNGNAAESGAGAVLLDVREPYEWQAGHAPEPYTCPSRRWRPGPGCLLRHRQGPWS